MTAEPYNHQLTLLERWIYQNKAFILPLSVGHSTPLSVGHSTPNPNLFSSLSHFTFHNKMGGETHQIVLVIQKALGEVNLSQSQGSLQVFSGERCRKSKLNPPTQNI